MYLAIVITLSSIMTFALNAPTTAEGTPFSIFKNVVVVAQEGAINPTEDSVNDTQVDKDRVLPEVVLILVQLIIQCQINAFL